MSTLPDITRSRHRGSPESEAANRRIHHAKYELRTLIFKWFLARGSRGATCEEASRETGIAYQTMSARTSEMKRDGQLARVTDAQGAPVRKKTTHGSSAGVWRAVSRAEREGKPSQERLF